MLLACASATPLAAVGKSLRKREASAAGPALSLERAAAYVIAEVAVF